ncbi:hypothetical protein BDW74DRAFT_116384 [Aspergillus multicolor]|uniref:uncharacterized protein n=1 Tax=Aspergillus multicolor TaxID=41759 RepID=UPI003CCCBD66
MTPAFLAQSLKNGIADPSDRPVEPPAETEPKEEPHPPSEEVVAAILSAPKSRKNSKSSKLSAAEEELEEPLQVLREWQSQATRSTASRRSTRHRSVPPVPNASRVGSVKLDPIIVPVGSDDELRARYERRHHLRRQRILSTPRKQFESDVKAERGVASGALPDNPEGDTAPENVYDDEEAKARKDVRARWILDSLWDGRWDQVGEVFGNWKHEYEQADDEDNDEDSVSYTRPEHQFFYQIEKKREHLRQVDVVATDNDLDDRLRAQWVKLGLWNVERGENGFPGCQWNHEIPEEQWLLDQMGDDYVKPMAEESAVDLREATPVFEDDVNSTAEEKRAIFLEVLKEQIRGLKANGTPETQSVYFPYTHLFPHGIRSRSNSLAKSAEQSQKSVISDEERRSAVNEHAQQVRERHERETESAPPTTGPETEAERLVIIGEHSREVRRRHRTGSGSSASRQRSLDDPVIARRSSAKYKELRKQYAKEIEANMAKRSPPLSRKSTQRLQTTVFADQDEDEVLMTPEELTPAVRLRADSGFARQAERKIVADRLRALEDESAVEPEEDKLDIVSSAADPETNKKKRQPEPKTRDTRKTGVSAPKSKKRKHQPEPEVGQPIEKRHKKELKAKTPAEIQRKRKQEFEREEEAVQEGLRRSTRLRVKRACLVDVVVKIELVSLPI